MKKKFSKILGVGLTLVLVFALTAGFSLPVGASPDENEWSTFDYPVQGEDGGWFYDPGIAGITAIDQAINGDLYAYVDNSVAAVDDLFISTDGGRSWSQTDYKADFATAGDVVDIACSSVDEEIVYVTDGALVYKSEDSGDEWAKVAGTSLTTALGLLGASQAITSLAVGYDRNDDPLVFVGSSDTTATYNGGILYIAEESYPSVWTDLGFAAYDTAAKTYDVMSIGVSPEFADDDMLLAVVTSDLNEFTDVVSNTGTVADWDQVSNLVGTAITGASDICFPDDYEDSETVFVGIVDALLLGDVYLVTDTPYDLDIAGTGVDADVIGLDILGETDEATLVAGTTGAVVWYSTDGGWDWDETDKVPSGTDDALIVLTEDSVLAATSGANECALSMSVDGGALFNQISLISTDITQVVGVGFSNEYAEDDTMFLLTTDTVTDSLLRYDGSNWERVAQSTVIDATAALNMVGVSPDYTTDNTVFLGDATTLEIFYTNDAGNEWAAMRYDPDFLSSWLIIDGDTIIVGGVGEVQQTTRSGSRPWEDAEQVAAAAGTITSIAMSGDEILVGDDDSQVFISPDGELDEFEQVDTVAIGAAGDTFVAFGSDILYAASGAVVARCVVDADEDWEDQEWEEIATPVTTISQTLGADAITVAMVAIADSFTLTETKGAFLVTPVVGAPTIVPTAANVWTVTATGALDSVLVTAIGTTTPCSATIVNGAANALTLAKTVDANSNAVVPATIGIGATGYVILPDVETTAISTTTIGLQAAAGMVYAGTLYVVDNTAAVGLWRSLNPDEEDVDDVVVEVVATELAATATLALAGFTAGSNVVWATDGVTTNLWTYEDTLTTEVVLSSPVSGMSVSDTDEATLEWFELTGADEYEIAVDTSEDFDGTDVSPADTDDLEVTIDGLDSGTTYYWKVRVASGEPLLSPWSEVRSFITALEPVEVGAIWVPEIGATDISPLPAFMWTGVDGATNYKIVIATDPNFAVTSRLVEVMVTTNAYAPDVRLGYNTTYYWRVKAYSDSVVVSDWTTGMFTTMAKPVPATPPVEVVTPPPSDVIVEVPPAIEVIIPAAQVISPTWIYVIIGVGAVLAIAVVVLIVRTRRVS